MAWLLEVTGLPSSDSSCSIRLADGIEQLEAALGKPVTSSNHAMAWHCLRLAGVTDRRHSCGRLFMV